MSLTTGGRVFFLRSEDIDWIEAAWARSRTCSGSRIVNTERIKELQPWFNGEYVVVLRNGTRLPLSRGYRDKLQEQLGKGLSAFRPGGRKSS